MAWHYKREKELRVAGKGGGGGEGGGEGGRDDVRKLNSGGDGRRGRREEGRVTSGDVKDEKRDNGSELEKNEEEEIEEREETIRMGDALFENLSSSSEDEDEEEEDDEE